MRYNLITRYGAYLIEDTCKLIETPWQGTIQEVLISEFNSELFKRHHTSIVVSFDSLDTFKQDYPELFI